MARVFFDVAEWMAHCREYDFVIGTRIHGTMVALQAGTPALCIVHDSRTLELCETMCVPHVHAEAVRDGITRDALIRLFEFDRRRYLTRTDAGCARDYVSFLECNGVKPVDWLKRLRLEAAAEFVLGLGSRGEPREFRWPVIWPRRWLP